MPSRVVHWTPVPTLMPTASRVGTTLERKSLLGQESPRNEPARWPVHQEKLTVIGGALESAP